MRSLLFPCLLLSGAVAAHAQSATTFQLPPDPESTSRPQAQGPTDLEGETRTAPRIIVEPTASPSATPTTRPSPRASGTPAATTQPAAQPTRSSTQGPNLPSTDRSVSTQDLLTETPTRSTTRESRNEDARTQDSTPEAEAGIAETTPVEPASPTLATPGDLPPADLSYDDAAEPPAASEDAQPDWLWIAPWLAALIALVVAAITLLMRRRRRTARDSVGVVELQRMPLREVEDDSEPAPPAAASLEVEAYAVTLSRSVMNATISYRLTILNRGRRPVTDIQVGGDVTTAHGRVPAAQQLADTDQEFPELHMMPRLEPGERSTVRGELRLPLREVRALRQGNVPVFVPLLRLTVRAADMEPRAFTYVIGSKPVEKGARPNPFRLDEPPRSYAQLTTRAVA